MIAGVSRTALCVTGLNSYGQLGDGTVANKNSYNCSLAIQTVTITATANPAAVCPGSPAVLMALAVGTGVTPDRPYSYTWVAPAGVTLSGASTSAVTATPTTAGVQTFTVTVAGQGGLPMSTTTVSLTVNALPTGSIAGNLVICAGTVTTLTASGGIAYSWSNGQNTPAITVSPTSTTVYSVTITNVSGCQSVTSATVTVNPLPTVSIAAAPSLNIPAGSNSTLTASGATTYKWSNGQTTPAITVSTAGPYSVTGTSEASCSATASVVVSITTVVDTQAPTAPTNLAASELQPTSVKLTWSPSTDNVGVTGYRVYVDGTLKGTSTENNFAISGLTAAIPYSIYVQALDAAGNISTASTALKVTTSPPPDTQAPSVPTNVTSSELQPTSVRISWSASTDNVGVKEYQVFVDGALKGTTAATNFAITGLSATTPYSIYVVAVDAAGNVSAASVFVKVTTPAPPDTQAPSAPTNLTPSDLLPTSVKLSWTPSADNVGVKEYQVYVNGQLRGSTTTPAFSLVGLASSTAYLIYVQASDAAGNISTASTVLTVTTPAPPDTQAPTAPSNLTTSEVQATTVRLNWSPSTDNIGVTAYLVYVDGTSQGNTSATSFTVTGLTASTPYSFYVVAVDAAGNASAASASAKATTLPPPDTQVPTAPTNLTASAAPAETTSLRITWTASTDNVGVKEYRVFVDNVLKGTTAETSFSATGLTSGTPYSIYVVAVDAAGNISPASTLLKVSTNALITAVDEDLNSQFNVYPNPFSEQVTVKLSPNVGLPDQIELLDLQGRVLLAPTVSDKAARTVQFETGTMPAGLFFIQIKTKTGVVVKKVLKL